MLVFLICIILLSVIVVICILTCNLELELYNFRFIYEESKEKNIEYKILLKIKILWNITIRKIVIDNKKIQEYKSRKITNKITNKIKNIKSNFNYENKNSLKEILEIINKNKVEIKYLNGDIKIGTENASVTALLIPIISAIIPMIIRNRIKSDNSFNYTVIPLYINENVIKVNVSGIIKIKIINIINILFIIIFYKKGVKDYERTSNRRTYDYRYG